MANTTSPEVDVQQLKLKLECLKIASLFSSGIGAVEDNYKRLVILLNLHE